MSGRTRLGAGAKRAVLVALEAGNTRRAAAAVSGVGHDTLYRWLADDQTFSDAVEKAEAHAEASHVANIVKAATLGNWTASAWWLERRRSEDWGRKERVEVVNLVRQMAQESGLSEQETETAVQQAEAYLKEIKRVAPR